MPLPHPVEAKTSSGLLVRRTIRIPTFRGWILLFGLGCLAALIFVLGALHLLTSGRTLGSGILVIDGSASEYTLTQAVQVFKSGSYQQMVVTGTPQKWGSQLVSYRTTAERGGQIIHRIAPEIQCVQISTDQVPGDDTIAAGAVALRSWWNQSGEKLPPRVDVASGSVFCGRTQLVYNRVFLNMGVEFGVLRLPDDPQHPRRLWSSATIRDAIGEFVTYCYLLVTGKSY